MKVSPVTINVSGLDSESVINVARHNAQVIISDAAIASITHSSKIVEDLAKSDLPVYGISTGFGALATTHIAQKDRVALQQSLIRSHAAGMGDVVETEVVRAMQLLRLRTLCSGATGVRPVVAETIAAMLNASITPVVYEYGSLGCSGDLAPLSHCALALMGEGEVFDKLGKRRPALEVLEENQIPIDFIAGTSIGALIGGFYAAKKDIAGMEELAIHMNLRRIAPMFLDPSFGGCLISGGKIIAFIRSYLGDISFDKLQLPFTAIATNLPALI